jgi:hypothetical protein
MLAALLFLLAWPSFAQQNPPAAPKPPAQAMAAEELERDDEKMLEFLRALRDHRYDFEKKTEEEKNREWLAQVTFQAEAPRWYTMTLTKKQWERWARKAEDWKRYEETRWSRRDVVDRSESLRGAQIAAIVDALAVHINLMWPNKFTGALVESMQLFETMTREIPVEFRDEALWRAEEHYRSLTSALIPFSDEPLAPAGESALPKEREWSWRDLDPKLTLHLNPRADLALKEPSVDAGLGLNLRLTEDCRMRLKCGFDTKDDDASAELMFGINLH